MASNKKNYTFRLLAGLVIVTFISSLITPLPLVHAQTMPSTSNNGLSLPVPGTMVPLSMEYAPAMMKGIKVFPENPFRFNFFMDQGDTGLAGEALKDDYTKLIKYFLASLTVPEEDLWVNLSPYEADKIIPEKFGFTEMGRDLLAQDYLLKQLTSSLMYPENELGEEFWSRVHEEAYEKYGTTDIPVNTFNKVWIVPETAEVYVHDNTAFVVKSNLKVMLEEDYLAMEHENEAMPHLKYDKDISYQLTTDIIREVIIPEIEYEINTGQNFIQLRQVYNSLILATWYKRNLKESVLGKYYVDQNKVAGVDIEDKDAKQNIWKQYVESFEKGVYDYIKEEYDTKTQELVPRKYFSGGMTLNLDKATLIEIGDDAKIRDIVEQIKKMGKSLDEVKAIVTSESSEKGSSTPEKWIRNGKIFVPNNEILPVGVERNVEIKSLSMEEAIKYGDFTHKVTSETENFDPEIIDQVKKFVSRESGFLSSKVQINFLLERYFMSFLPDSQKDVYRTQVFDIFNQIKDGKRINTSGLVENVVDKLDYLLHPELFKLMGVHQESFLNFISKGWKEISMYGDVNQKHRRLDALIRILEDDAKGKIREDIKGLIRLFDLEIFGEEDLLRIKYEAVKNRENPKGYFRSLKNIVPIWEKDDEKIKQGIMEKASNLSDISEKEWKVLLNDIQKLGNKTYYQDEIDSIPYYSKARRFGIEIEYGVWDDGQNKEEYLSDDIYDEVEDMDSVDGINKDIVVIERKFPESVGFKNTKKNWKSVRKELRSLEGKEKIQYFNMHIHIDRTGFTEESEMALMNFAVAFEGILRFMGSSFLPEVYMDKVKDYPLNGFFDDEPIGDDHFNYINKSDNKDTIEFRFFQMPFFMGGRQFDIERLQNVVAVSMQIVEAMANRPEDFSFEKLGIPVLLGMSGKLVNYKQVAKFADYTFKENPEAKISFLKLISLVTDKKGNLQFRKKEDQEWMDTDNEIRDFFYKNGFGYLYELHKTKNGWDENIWGTLREKLNILKNQRENPERAKLIRFLVSFYFFTLNFEIKQSKPIYEMLQELRPAFLFDEINKLLKVISDEETRDAFLEYAILETLQARSQSSDKEIMDLLKKELKLAEGILREQTRLHFIKYTIPATLKASRQRSHAVVMEMLRKELKIAKGILDLDVTITFLENTISKILQSSSQRSDEVVMEILEFLEKISNDEDVLNDTRNSIPAMLDASTQRGDKMIIRMLKFAKEIRDKNIKSYFLEYVMPETLKARTHRTDTEVMSFLKRELKFIEERIKNEDIRSKFLKYVIPSTLRGSSQRSDTVVMKILRKALKLTKGILDDETKSNIVTHALPAALKASSERSDAVVMKVLLLAEKISGVFQRV